MWKWTLVEIEIFEVFHVCKRNAVVTSRVTYDVSKIVYLKKTSHSAEQKELKLEQVGSSGSDN